MKFVFTNACLANAGRSRIGEAVQKYALDEEIEKGRYLPVEIDSGGINIPQLLSGTVGWQTYGKQFLAGVRYKVEGSDSELVKTLADKFQKLGADEFAAYMENEATEEMRDQARDMFMTIRPQTHRKIADQGNQALIDAGIPENYIPGFNQPLRIENYIDVILMADGEDRKKVNKLYNNIDEGQLTFVKILKPIAEEYRVETIGTRSVIVPKITTFLDFIGIGGDIKDDPAGGIEKARQTVSAYMDNRHRFIAALEDYVNSH